MKIVEKKNSYEILCAAEKKCMVWDKKRSTLVKECNRYSFNELLDLRGNRDSMKKPECYEILIKLELSSEETVKQRISFQKIMPEFAKKTTIIKKVPETIFIHISLDKKIELSKTENAWKPSNLNEEEILQNQKTLLKSFRSSLNKLTPENFDVLLEQLKKCKIETVEELSGVVELIFEKAVDEPNFVTTYTKLCSELQSINVYENLKGTEVCFQKVLIDHCQMEFEKVILEHRETMKLRKRSCGTVIFIGELYNSGILISEIMHECIKLLLEEREDLLESLCRFLTIIGSNIEKEKSDGLQEYLLVMEQIVKNKPKHINVRIRFMIQDLIDLKKKKWITGVVKPTTLEAVEILIIKEEVIAIKALKENDKQKSKEEKNFDEKIPDFGLEPKKINFVGVSEINSETKLGCASQFRWGLDCKIKVEPIAAVRLLPLPAIPPPTFSSFFTSGCGGFNMSSTGEFLFFKIFFFIFIKEKDIVFMKCC